MLIQAGGVGIELPEGWDGLVRNRPRTVLPLPDSITEPFSRPLGERLITAHAANFSLPADDGDFGTTATATMPRSGVFASLVEFQTGGGLEPGVGLYEDEGVPASLAVTDFHPDAMLRAMPGQAGCQRFFTVGGRPFCLYAVIGSHRRSAVLVPKLNALLAAIEIS